MVRTKTISFILLNAIKDYKNTRPDWNRRTVSLSVQYLEQ